ncbi:MFS transporter [Peterkaempfera griseoplana]|uniref:MFS transporter n=1 Tax=Peterkaempfera griseoplana TaxID=66896 RepID=UPI00099F2F81|nr:MFS transporter [Peterkaempfera griseoplana]
MTHTISATTPAAPPPETSGGAALDPKRRLAFAVVLIAGFMDLVDTTIVNVTVPSIQHDLHADYAQIEWVIAAYVLSFAALLVLSGRLGDIFGRKRVFLIGMAGFTIASLLCGVAVNPAMLIAARFLQGAAAGLMVTQILAILHVVFPPSERGKAVAVFGGVTGSSAVFGLALGGLLVQWDLFGWEWRPIFLVNVPVGIAALIAGAQVIRESRAPQRPRLDLLGIPLAIAAVVLLVYPLTEGRRLGWPAWTYGMVAGALVLLALFLAYEKRRFAKVGSALVEFGVFRSRSFSIGLAVWFLFWIAVGGFFFVWTLFLQQGLGWTPMHAGLTAATFAVGVGIGAGSAPDKLVPKFGRDVLVAGGMVNAIGFVAFSVLVAHYGHSLASWQIIPVHIVSGIGFGLIVAPTLDLLLGQVADEQAGNASGLLNTVQQIGMALGVALIGVVFFAQVGDAAGDAADEAAPVLISALHRAGVTSQDQLLADFRTCVRQRADSVDPSKVPASCLNDDPKAAGAFRTSIARADSVGYSSAFRTILLLDAGILVIAAVGFLALPKHSRPVSAAAEDTEPTEVKV